jgi:hypothetical protein
VSTKEVVSDGLWAIVEPLLPLKLFGSKVADPVSPTDRRSKASSTS